MDTKLTVIFFFLIFIFINEGYSRKIEKRQLGGLVDSASSAVDSVVDGIQATADGFGTNLNLVLNSGVSLLSCLKAIAEDGGLSLKEVTKFGQLLRLLNKLGKFKYLGEIDTSLDFDWTILTEMISEATELSPCSNVLYQGDMLLSPDQMDLILEAGLDYSGASSFSQFGENLVDVGNRKKRKITKNSAEIWTLPITYKIKSSGLSSVVKAAIDEWESLTCVTFKETKKSTRSLRGNYIIFKDGDGCYSNVGKKTKREGQSISLTSACKKKYTVAHEIGHALGLWHEQARPDRDDSVSLNKDNVPKKYLGNFLVQSEEDVDTSLPYDYGSVMHYSSTAYAKKKGSLTLEAEENSFQLDMGQRSQISFIDVKFINRKYCGDKCSTSNCKNGGYPHPNDCSKCICPVGLGGELCESAEESDDDCSEKDLTASSSWQTIEIDGKKSCSWKITNSGGTVKIKFESMNFACLRTCKGYIEVKRGTDFGPTGERYCCKKPSKELTSEGDTVVLIYNGGSSGNVKVQYKSA